MLTVIRSRPALLRRSGTIGATRARFREARKNAETRIATGKGYPDRPAGAFSVPTEGMEEPLRTERLLAHPFALCRTLPGDAFQSRVGFLLFRVNALTLIGLSYRLIVLIVNILLAGLSGIAPLLGGPGSSSANIQCATVMSLQLGMAALCYTYRPDSDKIFSLFAGTQFLVEGLSTTLQLYNGLTTIPDTNGEGVSRVSGAADVKDLAFIFSILAVFVPMMQLVEQRLFGPCAQGIRKYGADPIKLFGVLWILAMGLPGMIQRAIAAFGGGSGGGGGGEGEGDGPTLQPDGVEAIQKATAKYAAGLASGGVKPVDIAKSSKPGANQAGWQQGGDDGGDGGDD